MPQIDWLYYWLFCLQSAWCGWSVSALLWNSVNILFFFFWEVTVLLWCNVISHILLSWTWNLTFLTLEYNSLLSTARQIFKDQNAYKWQIHHMTKGWMYTLYEDKYALIAEATQYTFRKLVFATFFFFLQWRVGGPLRKHAVLNGTAM